MLKKIVSLLFFTPLALSANPYFEFLKEEEPSLWVSLFALATVSMISLFLSSEKLKELDKKHKVILEKEKEIERKEQFILEVMSGKIETSTKGIIKHRKILEKNVFEEINPFALKEEIKKFQESESLLLDATHELIDFLKIKSTTLELKKESYKVSNVLNEMFSRVHEKLKKKKIELVYDISPDISPVLLGDSMRMEQILTTLVNDAIETTYLATVLVKVNLLSKEKITIDINNPKKVMLESEIKALLENYALKEEYKSQEKLYLYVAYQIIKQMQGSLKVTSSEEHGTRYSIELPYLPVGETTQDIVLNHRPGSVLLAVDDTDLRTVLSDRLKENSVKVELYIKNNIPKLIEYDTLIIDNNLLDSALISKIDALKGYTDIDVIVLKNNFEEFVIESNTSTYTTLNKPLLNEHILDIFNRSGLDQKNVLNTVILPETEETYLEITFLKETQGISGESFKQFSHLHILIVDDNVINQKILKGVFSSAGMMISIANNGLEALEEVKKNPELDIVFMDTNMPVMDGYEASKKIREFRSMKLLPIVGIENIGFNENMKESCGINAFLHKPFKIGQLYTALSIYTSSENSRVKFVTNKLSKYVVNKQILDVQLGISKANTAIFYKELLQEVSLTLNTSSEVLESYILKREYKEVKSFVLDNIRLSEIIGATGIRKILIEMIQTFDYKQELILIEYMPLYKKELNLLMIAIKEYLKT